MLQWTRPFFEEREVLFLGARFDQYKLLFAVTAAARLLATWIYVPHLWNEKGMSNAEVAGDIRRRLAARAGALRGLKWPRKRER